MSTQRFYASDNDTFTWPNGAIGHRPGGPMDCLGPYAKVRHCPIEGVPDLRLTCYATAYANTFFSVPACTRYRGQYIRGFFAHKDEGVVFHPYNASCKHLFKVEDGRYSLGTEWCGDKDPQLILRWCGDWVAKCSNLAEAFERAAKGERPKVAA